MKRIRSFVALAAAFLLGSAVWALPEIPELLDREAMLARAQSASAEEAPDANSLSLASARIMAYEPDGSGMMWCEFWIKALTDAGAKDMRDVPLWYKDGFSEAEFQTAEMVRADGSVEALDLAANVRAATANSNTSENIYDPATKRLVLTVPRVDVGDTLHVVLAQWTKRPRIPGTYSEFELFESKDGPIPYMSLTVLAPAELPLRSMALLDEVPGTVEASHETLPDGRTRHRWVAKDVPQTFEEENMPEETTVLQRLVASSFAEWEEVSAWYWHLCVPHLETTPEIDAKVRELTEGKAPAQQIEALFGFVAQGIRYMGIIAEDKAPGYEPHDVAMTFNNRYGVCRDKGALLVAMLRKAGFNAFPVLISAGSKRDKEVPLPYFNHAIVAIDLGDRDYKLVDPTDDTARAELPPYLNDCSFLVCRPEGETLRVTPVSPAEENLMAVETEGVLDASGTLALTSTLRIGGMNDNVYRPLFVKNTAANIRDRFDGLLKRVAPGAELLSLTHTPEDPQDISQPLCVTLKARVPAYAIPDEAGHTLLTLPFVSRTVGLVNFLFDGLDQPERKYDWVISSPCAVRETLTLRGLDSLGAPVLLPQDPVLKANGASYAVTCAAQDDGSLRLTRELELSHKTYTPEDYQSLRRFVEQLDRLESLRPLYAKSSAVAADAEVLRTARSVTLKPDGTTVRRTRRDIRVLTFQGKRALGEVKLWHNPAWQTLTLDVAETETANGDCQSVTPKEISELDADGAALYPRYPAPKQTVVSLPAVEIGSTTRLDYQIASTDARPYAETFTFGGEYPVREQSFSLTLPAEREGALRFETLHFPADAECLRRVGDGTVTYTWTLRNLPARHAEPRTPSAERWCPTLTVAMEEASPARRAPRVLDALEDASRNATAAGKVARGLVKGLKTDAERLRAIQAFMAQRIRTLGPDWDALPFVTVSSPDTVLADGYGNRLDRLGLWMAMLRAAGLRAEPVLANGDVCNLLPAPRCGVDSPDGACGRWLRWSRPYLRVAGGLVGDEGEFDEPFACAAEMLSLVSRDGTVATEIVPASRLPESSQTVRVVVDAQGDAVLSSESFHWGLEAGALRATVRDFTPELRRRAVAAAASALATGAVPCSEYVIDTNAYPVRSRLAVEAKGYAVRQGDVFTLPADGLAAPLYGLRGVRRENPIWQGYARESEETVEFWLPAGAEILSKPEPFEYDLPGGGRYVLRLEQTVQPVTGLVRLVYTNSFSARPALLDSWNAPSLIEVDRRLNAPSMKAIVYRLPKKAKQAAHDRSGH